MRAACRPEPVRIARWLPTTPSSAFQQRRPSVRTSLPGATSAWRRARSRARKPLTGTSLTLRGRPSGLVETAATKGVCRARPRGSMPRQRGVCLAPRHHRHDLVLHGQAVGCLTPRRRPSSTEEIPFFAVTIRWTASRQLGGPRREGCLLLAPGRPASTQCPRWPQAGQTKPSGQRPGQCRAALLLGAEVRETPRRSTRPAMQP